MPFGTYFPVFHSDGIGLVQVKSTSPPNEQITPLLYKLFLIFPTP